MVAKGLEALENPCCVVSEMMVETRSVVTVAGVIACCGEGCPSDDCDDDCLLQVCGLSLVA